MIYQSHFLYRFKVIFVYLLVKLNFLHPLLPKSIRDELPTGWNNHMFWVAFKSGGKKLYYDYYCKLREPDDYEPKTVVDTKYQLTEKDIRSFYENGYIGPFDVMSSEEATRVKEHLVNKLINKESNIISYTRGDYKLEKKQNRDQKDGDRESLSKAEELFVNKLNTYDRHLEDPVLLNLFKNPAITERCSQILGPDLLLWHSHFFWTPPLSSGSGWHQTSTWLSQDRKESVLQPPDVEDIFELTCWIALTDAPKERSCLTIIPGSQKEIYPVKFETDKTKLDKAGLIYGDYEGKIDYRIEEKNVKLLEAKAGQCIIFCERAVHGSTDNETNDWRWSTVGRIVRPDTRIYTKKMLEEGFEIEVYGAKKIKLDNWRAVLLRGKNRFDV